MKSIRFNLSAWVRPVRVLISLCVCALLLFSYASPAYSATKGGMTGYSGTSSKPKQGEENLLEIEKKSQEAVLSDPYSQEKTMREANKGLNEIQGDADMDKMKRPENTTGVESVEQKVEKALEAVTGND